MELFQRYVIDTNVIIDITRRIYPPVLREQALAIVEGLIQEGRIVSHKEVLAELEKGAKPGDIPLSWCKRNEAIFADFSPQQEVELVRILLTHPHILDSKKEGPDADAPLVALALTQGSILVTGDGSGKTSLTKMKQVCDAYEVRCISVYEFLYENGWTIKPLEEKLSAAT